jgi:hypothetical protein
MMSTVEAPPVGTEDTDRAEATATRTPDIGWVLGAVAGLVGFILGSPPIHDNSFLTHLATGRLILDEGRVPSTDPFSFTAVGEPWTVPSWLASVLYAGAEDLAGLTGVRLLHGLLVAAIAVGLWHLSARSRSLVVRAGVVLVALVVASEMVPGRPLLFGLLGFVLAFLALDGRIDPRWMVPVGYVWVNTHGSFPFALVLAVALLVGRRLDEGSWGPEVRVTGWIAGGLALGVVNPQGLDVPLYPTLLVRRTEAFRSIAEWQAPDYSHWFQIATVALVVVAAGLIVLRARSWRDAIVLVVFGVLGLTSARNMVVLLIVAVPVLAGVLPDAGPAVADVRRAILGPARVAVAVLVVVFAIAALQRPDEALEAYPVEAATWMEDEGLWGADSRVVAPDYVGNLRAAMAGPDARVFIDDRVDMYPLELIEDYLVVLRAEPGWQDVLARRGATAVLWERDTALGRSIAADPGWRAVHDDRGWTVFVPA